MLKSVATKHIIKDLRLPEKDCSRFHSSNVVDKTNYFLSGNADLCNKHRLCIKQLKWCILITINEMQKRIMTIPKLLTETKLPSLTGTRDTRCSILLTALEKHGNGAARTKGAYQKLEKTIKTKVTSNIRTHGGIKNWIEQNYKTFWDSI